MPFLTFVLVVLVTPFLFIIFFGAPYVPSFTSEVKKAFNELKIRSGNTVVDLGSGDGRILRLAALRGARGVGYELNPWLWFISQLRTLAMRDRVTIHLRNYLGADISSADVVFLFTSGLHKDRLEKKLTDELPQGSLVVSNGFQLHGFEKVKEIDSLIVYKKQA